jgi:hypothetical protein
MLRAMTRQEPHTSPRSNVATTPPTETGDIALPQIGTLNEGSLHASLKAHYAEPGDLFEVPVEGFVIDLVRAHGQPDELLIEIQTGSFGALGAKFDRLLATRRILLVHPIAIESVLHKPDRRPRRSPKHGSVYSLFDELVSIPTLLDHPNLELEVVLVRVAKHQVKDRRVKRGRGGYRTTDRTLDSILETRRFKTIQDLLELVPDGLPETFTTADLAATGVLSRDEAQRLAYCLKACGLFESIGRTRAGYNYRICLDPT